MDVIDRSKRSLLGALPLLAAASTRAEAQPSAPSPAAPAHLRKVALEEHFMLPEFVDYFSVNKQTVTPELYAKALPALADFGDRRLGLMDANGIDFIVLSLSGPGMQAEPDTAKAIRLARLANDRLAEEVHRRPTRYGGFAHLAMQDPKVAADELERCLRDYKFQGAMINGHTNGVYLDDRRYDVFWERVSDLGAPIYIHPANPIDRPHMYEGHPEVWGPTWSWAVETCTHALRLIFAGTFDRYPKAQVILGHMGETLPIQLWRLDSRYAVSNKRFSIQLKPSEYAKRNIKITTSGVCSDEALRCALDAIGPESVMFSIDYPFESTPIASRWISTANITEDERMRVSHGNAERILRLS